MIFTFRLTGTEKVIRELEELEGFIEKLLELVGDGEDQEEEGATN